MQTKIIRKKLSHSVRRYVRTQKAQIRRQFGDAKKQGEEIAELYKRLSQPIAEAGKVVAEVKTQEKQPKVKAGKVKVKK